MEALTTVTDKLKAVAKSAEEFVNGVTNRRRNPIDILKRLQREAFSDIMKIRDRQERVEKILTFYKSSKGGPFEEVSTRVKGKVDVLGSLFVMDSVDEQKIDAIHRSGIRTGIDARLSFQTVVREKDLLVAEFIASEKGQGDVGGGPLSLSKLFYHGHVNNWLSAVAIPTGGQCRDVEIATTSHQERGLTDYSDFGPPLLNQHHGAAFGIMVRKSNVVASLARFVSALGLEVSSNMVARSLSTFGQIVWQPYRGTKLSLLGVHRESVHKESRPLGRSHSLEALSLPVGVHRTSRLSGTPVEEDTPTSGEEHIIDGSIALTFETEIDEYKRIGGWIETKSSDPRSFQWSVTTSDTPEDELGWGLTLGGLSQGPNCWDHLQIETYLNFNFGKKFKLQPAVVYVKDGETQFPALMLRSSWSL